MGARPKAIYVRSESYRRYVASQACFACGIEGFSQAAHPNQAKYGKGKGIKASDAFCFPLCGPRHRLLGCHSQLDLCMDMTKAERDSIEDEYIQRMQTLAAEAGWTNGIKEKA
jgi:hypothetical protein